MLLYSKASKGYYPLKSTLRDRFNQILNSPAAQWGLLLFILAMIPRLIWSFTDSTRLFSDMEDYYLCAVNFLKGDYLAQSPDRLAYRAPLYPLFLALCLRILPGDPLVSIRIVQSALGSLSAVFLFLLARKLIHPILAGDRFRSLARFGDLGCFILGLLYAGMAYPIFFCSVFMTETLFITLFLAWVLWGECVTGDSPVWSWAGYSILLGLLILARPVAQFLFPIVLWKIWVLIPKERRLRSGCVPLLAWLTPILPWTIRNILIFHTFVFVSTNSGINLFIGNNPTFGYYESGYKEVIRRDYIQKHGPNEVGENRLFMRLGRDYILEDPKEAVIRGGYKFFFLYLLDKEPWPWEEYNRGRGFFLPGNLDLFLLRWKPWFLGIAVWGIVYAFVKRLKHGAMLGAIGFYTAAYLVFFAQSRFRMPLEPLLTIYMGLAALSLVETALWVYGMIFSSKTR